MAPAAAFAMATVLFVYAITTPTNDRHFVFHTGQSLLTKPEAIRDYPSVRLGIRPYVILQLKKKHNSYAANRLQRRA
ncbi:hypothetical protein IF1G_10185 [Cordyceps javanica]|uniref:Secreted protein n=1 Tax=Cordyceps javanica TaxID=43265 RepID=A0A545UPB7_9HYPO|nr:hypothetical protein IF1G_10185 [Cordyceps javanica]